MQPADTDENKHIFILGPDGHLARTGNVTYFGGTETISCNRCARTRTLWESVRIGYTAVCWSCLHDEEKQAVALRPESVLPLIAASLVADALKVKG